MKLVSVYLVTLVVFLVLDSIWLGLVARNVYMPRIDSLMRDEPRWGVAAVFYLLYAVGLVYFAVWSGVRDASWQAAAMNGAMLGFVAYLTYNATNLAVMKDYDDLIAVLDTAWGAVVSAMTSGLATVIVTRLWPSGDA